MTIARKMTITDACRSTGSPNSTLIDGALRELHKEAMEILGGWPPGSGMKLSFVLEIEKPPAKGN